MLLGHRSGIPEWDSGRSIPKSHGTPWTVWKVSEFLHLAAAQRPMFAPGIGFFYSSSDFNLLGLIIERITRRSWRQEVTRRVIVPLGSDTRLRPAPRGP